VKINFEMPITGMNKAREHIVKVADRISRKSSGNLNMIENSGIELDYVEILEAKNNFKANAIVFKKNDEMLGTLLDVLA